MTFLLAHGALGVWDEVASLTLMIGGVAIGLAFALLGRAGDREATASPDEDPPPTGPLIKARERK